MTYNPLIQAIFKEFISSTMWELQDMFKLNIITHSQAYFSLYFQTTNSHYLQNKKLAIKLAKL